jgi:hypothetical protein
MVRPTQTRLIPARLTEGESIRLDCVLAKLLLWMFAVCEAVLPASVLPESARTAQLERQSKELFIAQPNR